MFSGSISQKKAPCHLFRNKTRSHLIKLRRRATTMAAVEENWQTKRSTVRKRTGFVFNNELLSDIKFVVRGSNSERESKRMKMVIPAHKFVLGISSPVFFAMFYGQMAETTDSIELPDCEYESLLEFFRFLYTDEVNLSERNVRHVMHVLYLANKYMVPSLAEKCTEYLLENLKTSNVFCILPHAQKFEDKDLEERCWEVIEKQTEEAVTSDEFVTLERSLVESVVKREKLNVKEVELFKAVDRWAKKECERQGIATEGNAKRQILGDEIVKAMRFPLMSQAEFASFVVDSHIPSFDEVGVMMKYYSNVLSSPLPFNKTPRNEGLHQCHRFAIFRPPDSVKWSYTLYSDSVYFTVNKPIKLHGVQIFGCEGGVYNVTTYFKDKHERSTIMQNTGIYTSKKEKTHPYYGFEVLFNQPVQLDKCKVYAVELHMQGHNSWYGIEGQRSLESHGVQFTFIDPTNSQRTTDTSGQFPAFIFSLLE